jgi:DNA-directed RNA polymerase specialized sigma24 family protein
VRHPPQSPRKRREARSLCACGEGRGGVACCGDVVERQGGVDEESRRRYGAARKMKTDVDRLTRMADECAARHVRSEDHAIECGSKLLTDKVVLWLAPDAPGELGSDEELRAEFDKMALRWSFRRYRQGRKEQLFCETPGIEMVASREPGPDEIVQCAHLLERLLRPLPHLEPARRRLVVERILKEERFVDIARETGRSADALSMAMRRILDQLLKYHEGDSFDMVEAADYLRMVDEFRNTN